MAAGNSQFFGKKARTGLADDEMNPLHPRIVIQQSQHFLGKHRAARAGHTHSNNFFAVLMHVVAADNFSLAAAYGQVKQRQPATAVIDFSDGDRDELSGTFETSGIGAVRQTCAVSGTTAAEAPPVRRP